MMRTQGQPTVQGYNAQAAVTRGQIIVAAEVAVESPDFGHLEPVVRAALRELEDAGVTQRPEMVLADAGYWHTKQMENVVSDGIQVLVSPDAGLREGVRPGWDKGLYAFMRRVLASDAGHELYKHRKATVEPVFAQNKFNRGFRRFQRRGRAAARSEWRFQAATHNLLKLHSHLRAHRPSLPRRLFALPPAVDPARRAERGCSTAYATAPGTRESSSAPSRGRAEPTPEAAIAGTT